MSTVTGTDAADTLNGSQNADIIIGGKGNDILKGGADKDTYIYNIGDGDDTINDSDSSIFKFGPGITISDIVIDTYNFQSGMVLSVNGSGTITVPDFFNDSLYAGSTFIFDDGFVLSRDSFKKFLPGTDAVEDNSSGFSAYFFKDNDMIFAKDGNDVVYGWDGNDFINAGNGNDTVNGGVGDDILIGGVGDDNLYGMAGNDTLIGGMGTNTLEGGSGNDTYYADVDTNTIVEKLNEGTDKVFSSVDFVLSANVENLELTGSSDLTARVNALDNIIIGNSGDNYLLGGDGKDSLAGALGDDILDGQVGADTMFGGLGNETYVIDNIGDVVTELAGVGTGTDTVMASINYTLGANVENLALKSSATIATGNELANTLEGNALANTLDGKVGADKMIGGDGNDTYYVDNSADVINETDNAVSGTDTAIASVNYTIGANVEKLTLTGTAVTATGNDLANTLTGNYLANTLTGLAGDDILDGGTGIDTMIGGEGNDTYVFDRSYRYDLIDGHKTTQVGGFYTISDAAGNDTVFFGPNVNRNEIIFYKDGSGHLVVNYSYDSSSPVDAIIKIADANSIEKFELADGSYITNSDINLLVQETSAYSANLSGAGLDIGQINTLKTDTDYVAALSTAWQSW